MLLPLQDDSINFQTVKKTRGYHQGDIKLHCLKDLKEFEQGKITKKSEAISMSSWIETESTTKRKKVY